MMSNDPDPFDWLTIPEILTDLDVSVEDWRDWEVTGHAPIGVIFPDGQVRISGMEYERWLDSLSSGADAIRRAVRYAIKHAGERGLSRAELRNLFGPVVDQRDLDNALSTLLRAGECASSYRTTARGPEVRYRYNRETA